MFPSTVTSSEVTTSPVVNTVVTGFDVSCSILVVLSEVTGRSAVTPAVVMSVTLVLGANAVVLSSVVSS